MKIYDLIREDHDTVRDLIARIQDETESPEKRSALFRMMREDLVQHLLLEEEVVYDYLEKRPQFEALVHRERGEHERIQGFVEEMSVTEEGSDRWEDLFDRLTGAIGAHFEVEEDEFFDAMRAHLKAGEEEMLASVLGTRKAQSRSAAA